MSECIMPALLFCNVIHRDADVIRDSSHTAVTSPVNPQLNIHAILNNAQGCSPFLVVVSKLRTKESMVEINTNRVTSRGRKVRIKVISKEHETSVSPALITYIFYWQYVRIKFRHIRRAKCYSPGVLWQNTQLQNRVPSGCYIPAVQTSLRKTKPSVIWKGTRWWKQLSLTATDRNINLSN
jgi:hypothetical protein